MTMPQPNIQDLLRWLAELERRVEELERAYPIP